MSNPKAPVCASFAAEAVLSERQRILLVDDHPIVRQGLARVIDGEPDLTVCGEAETAAAAMTLTAQHRPALALLDLSLSGKPDVTLIRRLHDAQPAMRVLVVSMHDESLWAARCLKAGACGYVMKQEKPRVLVQRIRQALRGETAVSEPVSSDLLKRLTWGRDLDKPAEKPALGERETQVLGLLGRGHTSREIAAALAISVKTVDAHREHIKQKLGLRSAAELIHYAVVESVGGV